MRMKNSWPRVLVRLIGLCLLGLVLWRVDIQTTIRIFKNINLDVVWVVLALHFLLVLVKTVRWWGLMWSQGIRYSLYKAYLAYLGSAFIGLVTPGRLGEFIRAFHLCQDMGISKGRAFSSVLVDRIFDLYLLLWVGGMALIALGKDDVVGQCH